VYVPSIYNGGAPFEEGLHLRRLCSQPGGESRAIYNKERILSKSDKKFTIHKEDN
jgi:hypothetical protein